MERETRHESTLDRREFLKGTAAAVGAALLGGNAAEAASLLEKVANPEETKEKGPKLSFEFFYSSHFTGADKRGLGERVKDADIFVPEAYGWNDETKSVLEEVASGKAGPTEIAQRYGLREDPARGYEAPFLGTLRALHNTKVKVELLDIPASHPLTAELFEAHANLSRIDLTKDFAEHTESYGEKLKEAARLQVLREEYILERLASLASDIRIGKLPELKGKTDVRILLAYGVVHTPLSHALVKNGEDARRTFGALPYIFGYDSEAMRRFTLGKDVPSDLASRALMDRVVSAYTVRRLPGAESLPKVVFIRKTLEQLTPDELGALFEKLRAERFDPLRSAELIKAAFREKGVEWPLTREELEKALQ